MMDFTIRRLLGALNIAPDGFSIGYLDKKITGVTTDSRVVRKGNVFFALKGDRFDGAEFTEDAVNRGALCVIVNRDSFRESFATLPVLPVIDTVRSLGEAAHDYRLLFTGPVVGVTGSSGKTTTKEMIRAILGLSLNVHATEGNLNNHIGLPLTVFELEESHDCAVIEMGMSAPNEISYLTGIAEPDIGVILNVGPSHMEFFPSLNAVADAKMELIESLSGDNIALVNGDDPLLVRAHERVNCRLMTFGIDGEHDYTASDVSFDSSGCATFTFGGGRFSLRVPGRHMVYNACAALAVGDLLGVAPVAAAEALETYELPAMRMRVEKVGGITLIDDSYNANPLSMQAAVSVFGTMKASRGTRKIAVVGDMLELGSISEQAHRDVGGLFAKYADLIVTVGAHAAGYVTGAREEGFNADRIRSFDTSEEAGIYVKNLIRSGDIVLLKGSRGMKMETVRTFLNGAV